MATISETMYPAKAQIEQIFDHNAICFSCSRELASKERLKKLSSSLIISG
jgi:hypothetical protein